jgi:hypothetical protein
MTTIPYHGKIHLIAGHLAYLAKIHGVEPVREALDYHRMTPTFYDATAIQHRIEDTQQTNPNPTNHYVS